MESFLKEKVSSIVSRLYQQTIPAESILVNTPPKEFPCDFTVVIFPIAKLAKKSPDAAAKEIGEVLKNEIPELESFEVVKGFLNLKFTDAHWLKYFSEQAQNKSFGEFPSTGNKVMIEYAGPNTNKPLHLGHLRNIFLGYSMANILKAAGNDVVKVNIYNDRGIHICKSMVAYQKFGNENETPEKRGIKGDKLVGEYYVRFDMEFKNQATKLEGEIEDDFWNKKVPIMQEAHEMLRKWEEGDPEVRALWRKMNEWVYRGFEQTYRRIGVDFDKAYYESETYQLGKSLVEEGVKRGVFTKADDGSVWVDLTSDGLDQKLLLRADGTSVYITQDIATANERWKDFHPGTMIYTVANEQDYHFKVLKLICKKLALPFADGIYHLSYGMVDLPSGRMKSREGTVVDADELIDEMMTTAEKQTRELGKIEDIPAEEQESLFNALGLGALKFFILKVDAKKRMVFNPEESIDFHGFTGPFIQYTHARIKSVLRKASPNGVIPNSFRNPQDSEQMLKQVQHDVHTLEPQEREIILHLQRYPTSVAESASTYSPAILANYLYHLAKTYNHFYQEIPILSAENDSLKHFRLQLSLFVADVLKKGMKLLGIEVVERM